MLKYAQKCRQDEQEGQRVDGVERGEKGNERRVCPWVLISDFVLDHARQWKMCRLEERGFCIDYLPIPANMSSAPSAPPVNRPPLSDPISGSVGGGVMFPLLICG
jgi:hypothetical protein